MTEGEEKSKEKRSWKGLSGYILLILGFGALGHYH